MRHLAFALAFAGVLLLPGCKSKLDLETPRKYPCSIASGESQCPEGWRCGLEDTCHDRSLPGPYLCATNEDCEAQWHCGKARRCYDRADAGAIDCRPEVSEDCSDGWRCGLNESCHDRSVGADYPCHDDLDCEQDWRCDLLVGRCVDSRADALRDLENGPLRQTRISPLLPALPDRFAASDYFTLDDEDAGIYAPWTKSFSYVTDGGLTFLFDVWQDMDVNFMQVVKPPLLAGAVHGLANYQAQAYLLDDLGVWRYSHSLDGGRSERLASPGFAPKQLRIARGDEGSSAITPAQVVAFDEHRLAFFDPADGGWAMVPLPGSGARLLDLIETRYSSSYPQHFIASTAAGLYWARRDETGFLDGMVPGEPLWVPLTFPGFSHQACGTAGDAGYRALRVHADYYWLLQLVTELAPHPGDDGTPELIAHEYNEPYSSPPPAACGDAGWTELAPPTKACRKGERLLDFHPSSMSDEIAQTRCRYRTADGGEGERSYLITRQADGGFAPIPATLADDPYGAPVNARTTPSYAGQARASFADEYGRFWYGPSDNDRTFADVEVLPVAPERVVGGESDLLVLTQTVYDGLQASYTYELDPPVGLTWSGYDHQQLCASVRGKPSWVARTHYALDADGGVLVPGPPPVEILPLSQVLSDPDVVGPVTLSSTGQLGGQPCGIGSPTSVMAVSAALPDGGTELLVAGNDTVWAGDITPVLASLDAGRLVLDAKLVPSPRIRIDDLAALAPDPDGGELLGGYVLAQQRLFRFSAANETRWRADEVTLPAGDPMSLWADGRAGRVGYRDGRVYSLPSRVLIAPPLALPGGLGVQFGTACARVYAAAPDGLYRLDKTPDAGVGAWKPVKLDLAAPGALDDGAVGGKFYPTERSTSSARRA
ncbi:MAG: hypothetical protein ACYC8T_01080 [Myxococcaceae bacterium]